ncbi:hypothetical protein DUI87_30180 [Hirundo rustica rustica]|uniref:Uncharacterized protein n=1 Tax=Hirundo rustica rustica TaxID=333673 RepID=A0A3M0J3K1_HIRRU|nr:hypothetical protein DUI87_30180 [Hirundo rustica rustica]
MRSEGTQHGPGQDFFWKEGVSKGVCCQMPGSSGEGVSELVTWDCWEELQQNLGVEPAGDRTGTSYESEHMETFSPEVRGVIPLLMDRVMPRKVKYIAFPLAGIRFYCQGWYLSGLLVYPADVEEPYYDLVLGHAQGEKAGGKIIFHLNKFAHSLFAAHINLAF